MKKWFGVVILIGICQGNFSAAAEEMVFSFSPPPEITFIEKMSMKKIKDFGAYGQQVDEAEQSTKVSMRKMEEGWHVIAKMLTMGLTRNGQAISDAFSESLKNIEVTYRLDERGQILALDGFDQIFQNMKNVLPPEVHRQFKEASINKEIATYNGRVGDFVGKSFEIGDVWTSESQYPLPNGENIDFLTVNRFLAMEPCGQSRCVRIEFAYDANPKGLKNFLNDVFAALEDSIKAKLEIERLSEVTISGHGTRLIDPKTMLIYSEEITRTIQMPMSLPTGQEVSTKMKETRIYSYEF